MEPRRKKIWQSAFLFGIAGCMLGAILAYGFSTLAAIISGATLTLGVINALYGLLNRGDSSNSSVQAKLANTVNVNAFLKLATVAIWLTAIPLCIFGIRQTYLSHLKNILEGQKITINGLVLNAGGDPADNAVVTLLLSQRQEVVSAPGGRFSFSRIDFSKEPSKTVRIRASWRSHVSEITIDLTNGPPQGLTITLPPGDPPFRVTYFVLEGQAVDFLLHHKMNAMWEEKLGGQPFIVPNEVSQTLSDLVTAFSEQSGYTYFRIENKTKKKSYDLQKDNPSDERFFIGSDQDSTLYSSDPSQLIRSMEDERQPWHIFYSSYGKKIGIDSLIFRKFIDRKDLDSCDDSPFKSFYQRITKDYMPPDFGYVSIYFESPGEGCGDDDGSGIKYVATEFKGRSLGLRIAVLENITKDAISLDNFAIKINKQEKLRSHDDDKAILDSQPAQTRSLFPQQLLNPGEKIVIPLELPLGFEKKEFGLVDKGSPSQSVRGNITSELNRLDEIEFPVYEKSSPFKVSTQIVERILNRPSQDFRLDKEYLYGPSMRIDNVEIDKISYPFRQFDSAKIIIRGGTDEGSCPFVYTYSFENHSWLNEGVILYGQNAKYKEARDQKELAAFEGRVLIKEKEPEDSFIDAVYVKKILSDGNQKILYPKNERLRFVDHNYLRIRQGEEILIDFDLTSSSQAGEYILNMVGYYVPYNGAVNRSRLFNRRPSPSVLKTVK
jgi:hypothetical protein